MNQINIQYYKTQIGELMLGAYKNKLCLLDYRFRKMRSTIDNRIKKALKAELVENEDRLLSKTKQQIHEYLNKKRIKFDIPILIIGTKFQKHVWSTLTEIPYGSTLSYLEVANNINHIKAVRAVANANGANAIALIIPCHRVIGNNGKLVGYGGGLTVKKHLLKLEQEKLLRC